MRNERENRCEGESRQKVADLNLFDGEKFQ